MAARNGSATYPTLCDTVTVELHNPTAPYALAETVTSTINTIGYGNFIFSPAVFGNPYYIVVRHISSLETWSKFPVLFNSSLVSFDFTRP